MTQAAIVGCSLCPGLVQEYPKRCFVLLLDFDNQNDRARDWIPEDLKDKVFLLGVKSEPEELKKAGLGSFEDIGRALGKECREGTKDIWMHDFLRHNASELDRLERSVRNFLF